MSDIFDHEAEAFDRIEEMDSPSGSWRWKQWGPRQPKHSSLIGVDKPINHGKPWSNTNDKTLIAQFRNLVSIANIARDMGRTESAITARLQYLGYLDEFGNRTDKGLVQTPPTQRTPYVNMRQLITLLQNGYTTVGVVFPGSVREYTYKVSDALRATLKDGDQVVVEARDELKVVKVARIHDTPQLDVKAPFELKWVMCRVDREAYDDQINREREAVKLLETAERKKAQEEALQALLGSTSREELLALINPK